MAIYKNGLKIKSVLKGTTAFTKVYHGTDLVFSAITGGGEGHRLWRVNITATNGTPQPSVAEIVFKSGGVVIPTTSGTAIGESQLGGGYETFRAFNGNAADFWVSGTNGLLPDWIGYDFGAGNAHDINEIVWTARGDSWGVAEAMQSGDVQYSDDGSTWTTAWSISGQTGWAAGETRTFTKPAGPAYRFWALRIKRNQNPTTGAFAFSGLDFRDANGNSLVGGGTAIASGTAFGTPANLFDGDPNTLWQAATFTPDAEWVGYDFGSAVNVAQGVVTARNDVSFRQAPVAGVWIASTDGASWVEIWNYNALEEFNINTSVTSIKPTVAEASDGHRYVQLYFTASTGTHIAIRDLGLLDDAGNDWADYATVVGVSSYYNNDWGFDGYNAINPDVADSMWHSANAVPQSITLDLGAKRKITKVRIRPRDELSQVPTAFDVRVSNDNGTYTTDWSVTGAAWPSAAAQIFTKP